MSYNRSSGYSGRGFRQNGAGSDKPSSLTIIYHKDLSEVMCLVQAYNARDGRRAAVSVVRKDDSKPQGSNYWIEVVRESNVPASEAIALGNKMLDQYVNGGDTDEI